jgi:hypothetical protein
MEPYKAAFTLFGQKTVLGEAEPHLVSYHLSMVATFLQKIDRT